MPKPDASALAAQTAAKEAKRHAAMLLLAPGDEYFGPLKQSIIGIGNTIRDLGRRYDVNHDIGRQTFTSAQLTERAIRDWEKKYPKDDQLPRAVYFLQRLYTKVLTQESRDRARVVALWLRADFRRSPQALQLAKTLKTERLAAIPPPTPEPEARPTYASVFGKAYPSEFAPSSPVPSGSLAPVPASPAAPGSPGERGSPAAPASPVAPASAAPASGAPASAAPVPSGSPPAHR